MQRRWHASCIVPATTDRPSMRMTPAVPNLLPLLPELPAAPSPLVLQAAVLPTGGGAATLDFAGLLDAAAPRTPTGRMPDGGVPEPVADAAPLVAPVLPPAPQLGGTAPELPAELPIASIPERAAAMLLPTGKDLPGTGARLPLVAGSAPKPQRALADVVSGGVADPATVPDSPAVPALADIDAPGLAQADEGQGIDDAVDPDAAPVIAAADPDAAPVIAAADPDAAPVTAAADPDAAPVIAAADSDAAPVIAAAAPLAPIPAATPVLYLAAIPAGSGVASERPGAATSPLPGPALPAASPPPIMAAQGVAPEPGRPILPGASIAQAVAAPAAGAMPPSLLRSEPRDAAAPPSGPPRPAASATLTPADSGDDAALPAAPSLPSAPTAAPAPVSAPAGDSAMAAPAASPQGIAPAQFPTHTLMQAQPQPLAAAAPAAAADRGGEQRNAAGTIESTIAQVGSLREALREARPAMTVQHAEFGAVSVRLKQAAPDQWRAVLASRDPSFVPAIHAALDTRAVAAAADASASFAQHHGASQNGAGDQRYGASPNGGQGSSQPYPGHSGSHGGDAAPDHRRPSTVATLAGRSSEGDEGSDTSAAHRAQGGLFA